MIPLTSLQGQTFLVVGLGKSGMSAVHALQAAGITVYAWDDNADARAKVDCALAHEDDIDWDGLTAVVWSPGIAHTLPKPHPIADMAWKKKVPLICDVDLLARAKPTARFIGITGTNGKSTTTSLIAHAIQQSGRHCAVGGNLGHPVLELEDLPDDGVYVLELSSYQLELVPSLCCEIAVHLNISPDHIDRHGDLDGYVAAKMRLFTRSKDGAVAIMGQDDPKSLEMSAELYKRKDWTLFPISVTQQLSCGVYLQGHHLVDHTETAPELILDMNEVPVLTGAHNAQNAAAAYAALRTFGLSIGEAISGIRSFPGLAHRQERISSINGVLYINDSKATNADATERALNSYNNIFWIAGGMAKAGGIEPLAPYFGKVIKTYLIGEAAPEFAKTLGEQNAYELCGTLNTAFLSARKDAEAFAHANPERTPVVMLSPACASWDQFKSFEARGDAFRDLVLSDNSRGDAA